MLKNFLSVITVGALVFSCKTINTNSGISGDSEGTKNCTPTWYTMSKLESLLGSNPCKPNAEELQGFAVSNYDRFGFNYEKEKEGSYNGKVNTAKGQVELKDFALFGSTGNLDRQMTGNIANFTQNFKDKDNAKLTYRGWKGNFMKTGKDDISCGYTGPKSGYPLWVPVEAEYIAGMPSFEPEYCGACMKFSYEYEKGKFRDITLLYGDNLYQYSYGSSSKHMDISNAAFYFLKEGAEKAKQTPSNWMDLGNHTIGGEGMTVSFARCEWGDKKMSYATKYTHITNIRRSPYAIGSVATADISADSDDEAKEKCESDDLDFEEMKRNSDAGSWNLYDIGKKGESSHVCIKMKPLKYEDEADCAFIDIVNLNNRNDDKTFDGINNPGTWTCTIGKQ